MNIPLSRQSCETFMDMLASKEPIPGGGGAAAMAGSMAAALCSMVGNLTIGRKRYEAVEADIRRILHQAETLQTRLLELVDEDARAFFPLSQAYAIPKDNPLQAKALEKASLEACRPPMDMMRTCCETIELLEELLDKGNAALISDVGCGALLCRAALESAHMNVWINTSALSGRGDAAKLEREADDLLNRCSYRAGFVAAEVSRRLRKEV